MYSCELVDVVSSFRRDRDDEFVAWCCQVCSVAALEKNKGTHVPLAVADVEQKKRFHVRHGVSHTRRHVGPQLVEVLDVIRHQSQDAVSVACVVGSCWRFGSSCNGPIAAPVSWPGQTMPTSGRGPPFPLKLR